MIHTTGTQGARAPPTPTGAFLPWKSRRSARETFVEGPVLPRLKSGSPKKAVRKKEPTGDRKTQVIEHGRKLGEVLVGPTQRRTDGAVAFPAAGLSGQGRSTNPAAPRPASSASLRHSTRNPSSLLEIVVGSSLLEKTTEVRFAREQVSAPSRPALEESEPRPGGTVSLDTLSPAADPPAVPTVPAAPPAAAHPSSLLEQGNETRNPPQGMRQQAYFAPPPTAESVLSSPLWKKNFAFAVLDKALFENLSTGGEGELADQRGPDPIALMLL